MGTVGAAVRRDRRAHRDHPHPGAAQPGRDRACCVGREAHPPRRPDRARRPSARHADGHPHRRRPRRCWPSRSSPIVAVPAASMRLSLPVGNSEGADTTQHRAYDIVAEKLGDGANGPLLVVADLPGRRPRTRRSTTRSRSPGARRLRRRRRGRPDRHLRRPHGRRLPGPPGRGAHQRLHRAARGRPPRRLAARRRDHARRRRPGHGQHRHQPEAGRRAAALPRRWSSACRS